VLLGVLNLKLQRLLQFLEKGLGQLLMAKGVSDPLDPHQEPWLWPPLHSAGGPTYTSVPHK
jgi:hypothetical protein